MSRSIPLSLVLAVFASGVAFGWQKKAAPLMTSWADDVTPENVLPEYPRPQMVRAEWMNLNGVWEFDCTRGITNRIPSDEWTGCDRAIFDKVEFGRKLPREILVPFPVESALSGVMERAEYLKYRRMFRLPKGWRDNGRHVRLNFDAVDWKCDVYLNGKRQGGHEGGYDAFSFDVTTDLKDGDNELIVTVYDPTDNGTQPVGKQRNEPEGYWYTPCSGIWQTVWLEPVDEFAATGVKLIPHVREGWLGVTVKAPEKLQEVELEALDGGKTVAKAKGYANSEVRLDMPEDMKLWSPDSPFLYDLRVRMTRRYRVVDEFTSYFGMRELGKKMIDGVMRPTINGKFVFQNGTLDQGYWPDGNLRAPTDEALKSDIVKHKQLGFNLIRKHIKVEPQRWFYWCDRIGMLVWQDMPSMHTHAVASRDAKKRRSFHPNAAEKARFEGELKEMIDEHISSPSVVCWILFNEGWGIYEKEEVKRLADWVSRYDPSRWLNDSTGLPNGHAAGDVYDVHIYKGPSAGVSEKSCFSALGEWGGVGLNVRGHTWFERGGWSYDTTKGNAQLNERYLKMQDELLNNMYFPGLSAAMYTQISDVEGETNGILTYDRKVCKFDEAALTAKHDRLICESKNLKKVTDANAGVKLPSAVTVKADADGAYVFAKADGEEDSLLTVAVAETRTVVPAKVGAEAGVVMRLTAEGGYLLGIRGDGTLFIRAIGSAFGEKAPSVEKKTALKGEVVLKATACGSMLSVSVGRERLVLHDARCPVGRCGVYVLGADVAFKDFKVSNPGRLIRWMNGPVKYWVTRDEDREVVGPDGKKSKIPEVRAIVDCNAKVAADAYWEIEKGLADDQGVSFRHMGHPGSYLALDADGFCNVIEDDGSADFAKRATWYDRPGHEMSSLHSFESCAEPGKFLRTRGRLRIDGPKTGGFRLDSTFEIVDR